MSRGRTTGEINAHFAEIYGASVSEDNVSRIPSHGQAHRLAPLAPGQCRQTRRGVSRFQPIPRLPGVISGRWARRPIIGVRNKFVPQARSAVSDTLPNSCGQKA